MAEMLKGPIELVGSLWRREGEGIPYRAQNTRVNVQTAVHELGLKRIDTGDEVGVGYAWVDPMDVIDGNGWFPEDDEARELVKRLRDEPDPDAGYDVMARPVTQSVMRTAALEAINRGSEGRERDPRLSRLSLGELVNRGAVYMLEIEARFNGDDAVSDTATDGEG